MVINLLNNDVNQYFYVIYTDLNQALAKAAVKLSEAIMTISINLSAIHTDLFLI